MKETKRTFRHFKFFNRSGMQAYLEEMAKKGWLLTKVTELSWHFRRIKPAKLHFSVVFFPQASIYEAETSEQQQQFHEFCAHTGWKLAASNAQLQFFYNEAENPVPIETDAVLEVENIHKSVKKLFLPGYYGELFLSLLNLIVLSVQGLKAPISILSSNGNLLYFLCWFLVVVLSLTEITGYTRWYKKARKTAETENSFKEPNGHPEHMLFIIPTLLLGIGFFVADKADRHTALFSAFAVAGLILFIAIVGVLLFLGTMTVLKKCNAPVGVTRIISPLVCGLGCLVLFVLFIVLFVDTLVKTPLQKAKEEAATYEYNGHTFYAYRDTLPFTVSDLRETGYTEYSRRCSTRESFFLAVTEAYERPRYDALSEPGLNYRILRIKTPFLYEYCLDALLTEIAHNYGTPEPEIPDWAQAISIPADPWGADKAYQLFLGGEPQNRYILCYDEAIVEINIDWEADEAAVGKINHTLTSVLSDSMN